MDKIYSRPRLLLPKIKFNSFFNNKFNKNTKGKKNTIKRKITIIAIIFIIAITTMFKMLEGIDEIIVKQCEDEAKAIATRIVSLRVNGHLLFGVSA